MSRQRRRDHGTVEVWHRKIVLDRRGNRIIVADTDKPPIVARAAIVPDRSTRAEVPGQQTVEVYRILVDPDVRDVQLWGLIRWQGRYYDIANPAVLHLGTRRTRHWTAYMRNRPEIGPEPGKVRIGTDI